MSGTPPPITKRKLSLKESAARNEFTKRTGYNVSDERTELRAATAIDLDDASPSSTPSASPSAGRAIPDPPQQEVIERSPPGFLSLDIVLKACPTLGKQQPESGAKFLRRVAHLSLQSKGLTDVSLIGECTALRVLYLYSNRLPALTGVQWPSSLTHLYIQENNISSLKGLECAVSLQKLYAGDNRIRVLDSIGSLRSLIELHIPNQVLDQDWQDEDETSLKSEFTIDEDTASGLSSLKVLNLSRCPLQDIRPICRIPSLVSLDITFAAVQRVESVCECLSYLSCLTTLSVIGNPFSPGTQKNTSYHPHLILASGRSLSTIDGRVIGKNERDFVIKLSEKRSRVPNDVAPRASLPEQPSILPRNTSSNMIFPGLKPRAIRTVVKKNSI